MGRNSNSVLICVVILLVHPYKSSQYGHGHGSDSGSISGSFSSSGSSSSASSFASSSSYASSGSYGKSGGSPSDIVGFLNGLGNFATAGAHSAAGASAGALPGVYGGGFPGAIAGASSGAASGALAGALSGSSAGSYSGAKGSALLKKHGLGVGGGVGIADGDSLVGTGDFGSAAIKANCGQNSCSHLGTGHLPLANGPDALESGGLGPYANSENFKIGPHKPSGYGAKTNSGAGVGGGIGIGAADTFLGGGVKQNDQNCGPSGCGGADKDQSGIKPVVEPGTSTGGITCSGLACLQSPGSSSKPCSNGGCGPDSVLFPGTVGGYGSASSSSGSPGFVSGDVVISKPGQPDTSIHFGDGPSYSKYPGLSTPPGSSSPGSSKPSYGQSPSGVPTFGSGTSPDYSQPGHSGGCGTNGVGCSTGTTSPGFGVDTSPDYYQPTQHKPTSPDSSKPSYSQGPSGTPTSPSITYPGSYDKPSGNLPTYNKPGQQGSSKPSYGQGPTSPSITSPGISYPQQGSTGCGVNGAGCPAGVSVSPGLSQPDHLKPSYGSGPTSPSITSPGSYSPQGSIDCGTNGVGCSTGASGPSTSPGSQPDYSKPSITLPGSSYSQQGPSGCGVKGGVGCSPSAPGYTPGTSKYPGCTPGQIGCSPSPTQAGSFAGSGATSTSTQYTQQGSLTCGPNGVGCDAGNIPKDVYPTTAGEHKPSTELEAPYPSTKPGSGSGYAISPTSNIIPGDGFHYTGPFPGPQGSIHKSKPTRKPSGSATSVPSLIHGHEVTSLRPNYDSGSSPSGADSGSHYNGPFPGRPGSIHDSKPATKPGSKPSHQQPGYGGSKPIGTQPTQPGIQPSSPQPGYSGTPTGPQPTQPGFQPSPHQPGYSGSTPTGPQPTQPGSQPSSHQPGYGGSKPAGHYPSHPGSDGVHYTGPFPGPTGPIDASKPATSVKPIDHGSTGTSTAGGGAHHPKPTSPSAPVSDGWNDVGVHYNGPFPGPSGSIHDSKPAHGKSGAHAGSTAGTSYKSQQPTASTYPGSPPYSSSGASATAGSTASAGSFAGSPTVSSPSGTKPGYDQQPTPSYPTVKPGKPSYGSKPGDDESSPIIRVIPTPTTKPASKPDISFGVSDEFASPSKSTGCSSGNCDVKADVGQGCGGSGCAVQPDGSSSVKVEPCTSGNCGLATTGGVGCGPAGCGGSGGALSSAGAFAGSSSSSGALSSSGGQGGGCAACSGLQSLINGFGAGASSSAGSYSGSKGGSYSGSKSGSYASSGSGSFGFGGAHAGSFASSFSSSGSHAGHHY